MKRSLTILALLLVAGCASNAFDEPKNWGPERIYSAAREELESKLTDLNLAIPWA